MSAPLSPLDAALPLVDPKVKTYNIKLYRQKSKQYFVPELYACLQYDCTTVLISKDCLTIPFKGPGPTPKNDHPFPHPSFFIVIAKRECVNDGTVLGVQNSCEIWLGDDDDDFYRVIIDDCLGILEDYLIFNGHGYDGVNTYGHGIICIKKKFTHPSVDVFAIAKSTPLLLDQEVSAAWTATRRSCRIDSTFFFPPGYISHPLIYRDVRNRTPTCSVERLAMYHHPSATSDPPSLFEGHEDVDVVQSVNPLYKLASMLKDNLLYTMQLIQGCFTYQET